MGAFRVSGSRLLPFYALGFTSDTLSTIRLGPRYGSREERVLKGFLRSVGLTHVDVERSVVPVADSDRQCVGEHIFSVRELSLSRR